MLGASVPDLNETPCPACEQLVDGDVVWDPWYQADIRVAAMPFHPSCAASALPPAEPTPAMKRCGICSDAFDPAAFEAAFAALHVRFKTAKGTAGAEQIVWRLAERDPRVFVAEHFACILDKVG